MLGRLGTAANLTQQFGLSELQFQPALEIENCGERDSAVRSK